MLDLSSYGLTIGVPETGVAEWFYPVLERGRGAAFVDTGFLKALFFDNDEHATTAREHFANASVNFYTTNLVLAETVRQITKGKHLDFPTKGRMFGKCSELLINTTKIFVCAPPRDIILDAYYELKEGRTALPTLDLCDSLSIAVLEYARHRRVFGFDDHFRTYGAQLEPNA